MSDSDSSSDVESEESAVESEESAVESETEVEMEEDGADADAESVSSNDENDSGHGLVTNEGWADSVAKILGSSKPKNKKTLVLSRAKKHSEIVKKVIEEKPAFEVIGEKKEAKPDIKSEEPSSEPAAKKKVISSIFILHLMIHLVAGID